jgi:hypothetical protein
MVYRVNHYDPNTPPIDVQDATLNTETYLTFVGKNWYGYGETIAENQLNLLENFAYTSTLDNPHPPVANALAGQIYYNKNNEVFNYFNGVKWNQMPGSAVKTIEVLDTDGALHSVNVVYDSDQIVMIISADDDFDVNLLETLIQPNFTTIGKGITLSSEAGYKLHGVATTAQYADLAEMYVADAPYEPGTVLKIGGEAEVTQTTSAFCPSVFGIVSTDPAYLMNSKAEGTTVAVALAGRVPLKVIGPVVKGQRLLASEEPGVARAPTDYEMQEYMDWYRIVGRALEDKTSEGIGLVEVVVGAK